MDDLEEYTNSSEYSRIRSATVEFAERDQWVHSADSTVERAFAAIDIFF